MEKSTEPKALCVGCNEYKLIRNLKKHIAANKKCSKIYSSSEENQNQLQRICDSYKKKKKAKDYKNRKSLKNEEINSDNLGKSGTSNDEKSFNQIQKISCKGCGESFEIGNAGIKRHLKKGSKCFNAYTTDCFNLLMKQCDDYQREKRKLSKQSYYQREKNINTDKETTSAAYNNPSRKFGKDSEDNVLIRETEVPIELTVTLKGAAWKYHSSKEGIYILQPNEVNGKKFWIQPGGPNAIWNAGNNYDKDIQNLCWIIGRIGHLGSSDVEIFSNASIGPLEATSWKYHKRGKLIGPTRQIILSASTYKKFYLVVLLYPDVLILHL